jgi:hypothetical protein
VQFPWWLVLKLYTNFEEIQRLAHENIEEQNKVFRYTVTHYLIIILFIIFSGSAAQRGLWPPRSRGFLITHNDAPQSVGPSG